MTSVPRARLLTALAVAAVGVLGGTARASTVVEGETLVSGGAATYADVVLDRPMRVTHDDPEQWIDADLEGDGEILGVEIRGTKAPDDPLRRSPPSVRILRVGPKDQAVESKFTVGVDGGVLPAGTYRIYLISDQPATARLRFPNQPGHTRVEAAKPYPFWGGLLSQRTWPEGTVIVGEEHPMPTRGLLMMHLMPYEHDDTMLADRIEVCLYRDGSAGSSGSAAFAPGCPGGATLRDFSRSSPEVRYVSFTVDFAPTGLTGFGANLERVGAAGPVYAAGAWVGYVEDEPPAPGAMPPPAVSPATPAQLALRSRRLGRSGGRAVVPVRCPGPGRCRGGVSIGSGRVLRFDLPAGANRKLRVPLAKRLRRERRLRATLTLVTSGRSSQQTARIRVTIG